ncbi:Chaperonin-like RbcX [Cynara cardunculus var. scolymus]|uniref:Chaperonin-like RbcX n=1 Tax=Cynara cardunculus var. scolymus TaxID=59895 RepID=A0A103Y244_CYNCS|nr:Chaperonin-like RbcX [Cynara cardunculus var. scolymus]
MMESSITILPLPHFSFLKHKPHGHGTTAIGAFPLFKQWKHTSSHCHRTTLLNCQKMYVPGFGEASPEAKAAKNLHNFFTYVAVRIVTAQLEELMEFLETHSLNDGDKFCAELMRESSRHRSLAMRILEVRSAYCKRDFEWDNLERLAKKMADESNTRLMRDYVLETSHVESEK